MIQRPNLTSQLIFAAVLSLGLCGFGRSDEAMFLDGFEDLPPAIPILITLSGIDSFMLSKPQSVAVAELLFDEGSKPPFDLAWTTSPQGMLEVTQNNSRLEIKQLSQGPQTVTVLGKADDGNEISFPVYLVKTLGDEKIINLPSGRVVSHVNPDLHVLLDIDINSDETGSYVLVQEGEAGGVYQVVESMVDDEYSFLKVDLVTLNTILKSGVFQFSYSYSNKLLDDFDNLQSVSTDQPLAPDCETESDISVAYLSQTQLSFNPTYTLDFDISVENFTVHEFDFSLSALFDVNVEFAPIIASAEIEGNIHCTLAQGEIPVAKFPIYGLLFLNLSVPYEVTADMSIAVSAETGFSISPRPVSFTTGFRSQIQYFGDQWYFASSMLGENGGTFSDLPELEGEVSSLKLKVQPNFQIEDTYSFSLAGAVPLVDFGMLTSNLGVELDVSLYTLFESLNPLYLGPNWSLDVYRSFALSPSIQVVLFDSLFEYFGLENQSINVDLVELDDRRRIKSAPTYVLNPESITTDTQGGFVAQILAQGSNGNAGTVSFYLESPYGSPLTLLGSGAIGEHVDLGPIGEVPAYFGSAFLHARIVSDGVSETLPYSVSRIPIWSTATSSCALQVSPEIARDPENDWLDFIPVGRKGFFHQYCFVLSPQLASGENFEPYELITFKDDLTIPGEGEVFKDEFIDTLDTHISLSGSYCIEDFVDAPVAYKLVVTNCPDFNAKVEFRPGFVVTLLGKDRPLLLLGDTNNSSNDPFISVTTGWDETDTTLGKTCERTTEDGIEVVSADFPPYPVEAEPPSLGPRIGTSYFGMPDLVFELPDGQPLGSGQSQIVPFADKCISVPHQFGENLFSGLGAISFTLKSPDLNPDGQSKEMTITATPNSVSMLNRSTVCPAWQERWDNSSDGGEYKLNVNLTALTHSTTDHCDDPQPVEKGASHEFSAPLNNLPWWDPQRNYSTVQIDTTGIEHFDSTVGYKYFLEEGCDSSILKVNHRRTVNAIVQGYKDWKPQWLSARLNGSTFRNRYNIGSHQFFPFILYSKTYGCD